jgi:hypothetical protein
MRVCVVFGAPILRGAYSAGQLDVASFGRRDRE